MSGLGGLHLEGLIHGGAYFRNFTVIGARCKKGPQMLKRICADHNCNFKGKDTKVIRLE